MVVVRSPQVGGGSCSLVVCFFDDDGVCLLRMLYTSIVCVTHSPLWRTLVCNAMVVRDYWWQVGNRVNWRKFKKLYDLARRMTSLMPTIEKKKAKKSHRERQSSQ